MLASVTQLQPRLGSFALGLAAFRAARLQACLSELNGLRSIPAAALRARALLRLGNPARALAAELLGNFEESGDRDRGELALLRAVAYSRLGDFTESEAAFLDARVYGVSSLDASLVAEVDYYRALFSFGDGALEDAREACHRALEAAANPPLFKSLRPGGVVPLAHVVARTQELLGVIDAAEGRYRDQLVHARSTIDTLDRCEVPDIFQSAFALANLAILVRDLDLPSDARTIVERVDTLQWTSDIAQSKFRSVEALGWYSALRGDTTDALRWFRRAADAASTVPEHIYVTAARSVLSRELGHRAMAVEEVEHALRLSSAFHWDAAAGSSRLALLLLAQAACPVVPARARETLERYRKISTKMHAGVAARIEARVRAEEAYTHGVILRAEGRLDESTLRLQTAFATWKSIGYEWRAAHAAIELAELNAGDVFRLAVARELRRRPDSYFAARARSVA